MVSCIEGDNFLRFYGLEWWHWFCQSQKWPLRYDCIFRPYQISITWTFKQLNYIRLSFENVDQCYGSIISGKVEIITKHQIWSILAKAMLKRNHKVWMHQGEINYTASPPITDVRYRKHGGGVCYSNYRIPL